MKIEIKHIMKYTNLNLNNNSQLRELYFPLLKG